MKDIQFDKKKIVGFFHRFHLVIFVVVVVLLLSIAILLLTTVANKASGLDSNPSGTPSSSFDETTMERIKNLKTSDEPSTPLDLSQGRIDPFGE